MNAPEKKLEDRVVEITDFTVREKSENDLVEISGEIVQIIIRQETAVFKIAPIQISSG